MCDAGQLNLYLESLQTFVRFGLIEFDHKFHISQRAKLLQSDQTLAEGSKDADVVDVVLQMVISSAMVVGDDQQELEEANTQRQKCEQVKEGYVKFFVPALLHDVLLRINDDVCE